MSCFSRRSLLKMAGGVSVAGLLAACGATPAPAATQAPAAATQAPAAAVTEAPAAATAAPAGKAHIVAIDTGDGKDMQGAFKPFMDANPDITVEVVGVAWDGYDEKVDLMIAGGDPPAIWRPAAKRGYRYYADKGMFPDIGPYIERDKVDVEDFYPTLFDFVKWEGKVRGFPAGHYLSFMFYNKTLLDKAGVATPTTDWSDKSWTWDVLHQIVKTVAKPDNDPTKAVWGSGGLYDIRHAAWIFGGDYFAKEDYVTGKPTKTIVNDPLVIDGLQFMQDLIYKDQAEPTPAQGQTISAAGIDMFLSGKVGVLFSANWSFGTYGKITDFEWGIAPVPGGKGTVKTLLWPDQLMMFDKQKYPEAAWKALKYITSKEGLAAYYLKSSQRGGGIPSRMSLASDWATAANEVSKLKVEMIDNVVNKGINAAGYVTASHAIIKFAECYDVAIKPQLDNLFLNKQSAKEAVTLMEPKINEILSAK